MRVFRVEINGVRRRDLDSPAIDFPTCRDYHIWLSENGFPPVEYSIIVHKPGSVWFHKKYGEATSGRR